MKEYCVNRTTGYKPQISSLPCPVSFRNVFLGEKNTFRSIYMLSQKMSIRTDLSIILWNLLILYYERWKIWNILIYNSNNSFLIYVHCTLLKPINQQVWYNLKADPMQKIKFSDIIKLDTQCDGANLQAVQVITVTFDHHLPRSWASSSHLTGFYLVKGSVVDSFFVLLWNFCVINIYVWIDVWIDVHTHIYGIIYYTFWTFVASLLFYWCCV